MLLIQVILVNFHPFILNQNEVEKIIRSISNRSINLPSFPAYNILNKIDFHIVLTFSVSYLLIRYDMQQYSSYICELVKMSYDSMKIKII